MRHTNEIVKTAVVALMTLLVLCVCSACNDVTIDGKKYDVNATAVSITDASFDDYALLHKKLPQLTRLDLRALSLLPAEYDSIASEMGEKVSIFWNVPMGAKQYPNTTKTLVLSASDLSAAAEVIPYFQKLDQVTVAPCELSEALCRVVEQIRQQNPNADIHCSSQIGGVAIDNTTEEVNLNHIAIADPAAIRRAIQVFPNIQTFEMCYCGLSNEVMGQLREDYPDVTFIWVIEFERFAVRTDAKAFSTLEYKTIRKNTEETFRPLFLYCTELRALDIGYHGVVDLSDITHLKKLQVLILADNCIKDVSPLAELPELSYLELFQNQIEDISPLGGMDSLEEINLCYNRHLQNATELVKCRNLKRLHISNCDLKAEEINTLYHDLPDGCKFNFTSYESTGEGWRETTKVQRIREAFFCWNLVKEYDIHGDRIYQLESQENAG